MFFVLGDAVPQAAVTEPRWPRLRKRSSLGIPPGAAVESRGCGHLRERPKCPRTHCRPRNQEWKTRCITDAYLCLQGDLGHDYVFNWRSEPSWRYYVCFDCSGHPAVPCRVWHGKAGDITRCGVSPCVLGWLVLLGTAGGSLLQWPTQMINEQVRPLL